MDAAFMHLEQHERGNYAPKAGARTKVIRRCRDCFLPLLELAPEIARTGHIVT
jgi:hypothetical protein